MILLSSVRVVCLARAYGGVPLARADKGGCPALFGVRPSSPFNLRVIIFISVLSRPTLPPSTALAANHPFRYLKKLRLICDEVYAPTFTICTHAFRMFSNFCSVGILIFYTANIFRLVCYVQNLMENGLFFIFRKNLIWKSLKKWMFN